MTTRRKRLLQAIIAITCLTLTWSVWAYATRAPYSDDYQEGEVKCPFLAFAPPTSSDLLSFAQGAQDNGMTWIMALVVAADITYAQKGLTALLRLEAPDLHRLEDVPGISHKDLYQLHLPRLRAMAKGMEVDGRLTLQQVVEMKLWVAQQAGVDNPGRPSRTETALAFLRAGGDLETWTVETEELLTLLSKKRPKAKVVVTPSDLTRVMDKAQWPKPLEED